MPASRDIVVKVSSESDAFLTKHLVTSTGATFNDSAKLTVDLLDVEVSEGYTKELKVLDSTSEEVLKGLTIWADDVTVIGSSWQSAQFESYAKEQFSTKATFNEEKGVYEVKVAKSLPSNLWFESDIDNDGDVDYKNEILDYYEGKKHLLARAVNVETIDVVYLEAVNAHEITVALTILDELGNEIEVRRVVVEGNDRGADNAVYDEATKQYIVDANFFGSLKIMIPSFEANGINYSSRNISIDYNEYRTSYNVYNGDRHYEIEISDNTLNIVTTLESYIPADADLQVVKKVNAKSMQDNTYQVYFNVPVELIDGEIYTRAENFSISSSNGVTDTVKTNEEVAHDAVLDLDNTRLTITAKGELMQIITTK